MPHAARQSPLRHAYKPLILLFVLFYLGFHAVSGDRGVYAWFKETKRLEALKEQLAEAKAQRELLERNVKGLSSASLDLDLLDERARVVLGYAGPDEMVIIARK